MAGQITTLNAALLVAKKFRAIRTADETIDRAIPLSIRVNHRQTPSAPTFILKDHVGACRVEVIRCEFSVVFVRLDDPRRAFPKEQGDETHERRFAAAVLAGECNMPLEIQFNGLIFCVRVDQNEAGESKLSTIFHRDFS